MFWFQWIEWHARSPAVFFPLSFSLSTSCHLHVSCVYLQQGSCHQLVSTFRHASERALPKPQWGCFLPHYETKKCSPGPRKGGPGSLRCPWLLNNRSQVEQSRRQQVKARKSTAFLCNEIKAVAFQEKEKDILVWAIQ